MAKKRLDELISQQYPQYSRKEIQSFIMQGLIYIDSNKTQLKSGSMVNEDLIITLNVPNKRYVSRGGYKLEGALDQFNIDVKDLVVLDAGISTGGFTDCLLQRGAKKVYGVDVGVAQVHEKIALDPRVILIEKTNIRYMNPLDELVDLIVVDLSFISVLKVIEVLKALLKNNGKIIILIKPQFEGEPKNLKKGIVKTVELAFDIANNVVNKLKATGLELQGLITSPITGTQGNTEYLAYFIKNI